MRVLNWLILTIFLISLQGCSTTLKQDINIAEVERAPLVLPEIDKLQLNDLEWVIVTEGTIVEIFKMLEKRNSDPVLFGLTSQGYENASLNNAQTLQLIRQQKAVIEALKEYYTTKDGPEDGDNTETE